MTDREEHPESDSDSRTSAGHLWKPGDVIDALYEVTGVLGKSWRGQVYRVHHRGWDEDMAVRALSSELGSREHLIRVCQKWRRLGAHPNIVSCYYTRDLGGMAGVFTEFAAGETLRGRISSSKGMGLATALDAPRVPAAAFFYFSAN
jgi:hypothetical protein